MNWKKEEKRRKFMKETKDKYRLLSLSLCTSITIYKGKKGKKRKKKISLLEQNFYACYELASRDNSTLTQLRGKRTILRMIEIYTWIIAREALRQILHLIKKTMRKPSLSRNEISRVVRVCIVCTIFRSDVDQRCDFVAIS